MEKPDRALARKIIDSLGNHGVPPIRGVHFFTVGLDDQIRVLVDEYLEGLLPPPSDGGTFKLVQGDFGCGKTHFLYCVLREARKRGYATALVSLSARETPFDRPAKVFQAVSKNISMPFDEDDRDVVKPDAAGFPEVLRRMATAIQETQGDEAVGAWCRTALRRVPVDIQPFRTACVRFVEAYAKGEQEAEDILEQWLLGVDVPDAKHRELGVFARVEDSNAFGMIASMVSIVRSFAVGEQRVPGVVLAFDEGDRAMSISVRRSQLLFDNMRRLIDSAAGGALPGVMMLYAVPPEFMSKHVADYPALKQRLQNVTDFGPANPSAPVLDLQKQAPPPVELLSAIGMRVLDIFCIARGATLNASVQQANASRLAKVITRETLASGDRRAFVRSWVALLQEQAVKGESEYDENAMSRIASGFVEEAATAPETDEEAEYDDV